MTTSELAVDDEGAVRILTFRRPRQLNAISVELAAALEGALRQAEEAPGLGAVVLTGVGQHFSAGGDAHSIVRAIDGSAGGVPQLMHTFHTLVRRIWNSPLPVIAAVSGVAYGGAFNLVLACDLAVCSSDARFCQVFLRRGLVPDLGGAFLLPRLVGLQRAKELMLLTPELDAHRAHALGLVNEVLDEGVDVRARAVELGGRLAELSPAAVALTKRLVNTSAGDLTSSLDMEAMAQAVALATPQARQGFERFL